MKPVYFIADLHLSPSDPATAEAFGVFIAGLARQAEALYILGDLFEFWIGDDQINDPFYSEQCDRLVALAATGVAIYFMAGNRDFLCGRRFALACGLTILPDPSIIEIEGESLLISHGDLFCTHDKGYQRYRRIVHSPITQWIWFHLPRFVREAEARRLRSRSRTHTMQKPESWVDVVPAEIDAALQQAKVKLMIHGHTHRPARHTHHHGIRRVLPDWSQGIGGYVVRDDTGWHLRWLEDGPATTAAHVTPDAGGANG